MDGENEITIHLSLYEAQLLLSLLAEGHNLLQVRSSTLKLINERPEIPYSREVILGELCGDLTDVEVHELVNQANKVYTRVTSEILEDIEEIELLHGGNPEPKIITPHEKHKSSNRKL